VYCQLFSYRFITATKHAEPLLNCSLETLEFLVQVVLRHHRDLSDSEQLKIRDDIVRFLAITGNNQTIESVSVEVGERFE